MKIGINQRGPNSLDGRWQYNSITTDVSKMCCGLDIYGKAENDWITGWCYLEPEVVKIWKGPKKIEDGLVLGLVYYGNPPKSKSNWLKYIFLKLKF